MKFLRSGMLFDYGMGALKVSNDSSQIPFQPIEVSRNLLSIMTSEELPLGAVMILENKDQKIMLNVVNCLSSRYRGVKNYELEVMGSELDLDRIVLNKTNPYAVAASPVVESVRYARFQTDPHISVNAKNFQTRGYHTFSTEDISRSGMLLTAEEGVHIPFYQDSIIEVTVVPKGNWLSMPVNALAKVTRVIEKTENPTRRFGVRFIEFAGQGEKTWIETVYLLESMMDRNRDELLLSRIA